MLRRWIVALRNAPLVWIAFALGLFVFGLTRLLPGANWNPPPSEQSILDAGYIEALRGDFRNYAVIPNTPQVFGAHVLTRYLVALVSAATGDAARAGVWLSLCGIVATLGGVYSLCRHIFPLRGFALMTVIGFGSLGTLHYAFSPDPSVAMGMGLVMWGVVFFVSSLEKNVPGRIFFSALFIGLAAYIRLELALIWVLLALYLLILSFFDSAARAKGMPLVGMALGGLLMLAMLLWPMIDRNLALTRSTAILPGPDAEWILGAPRSLSPTPQVSPFVRILRGFGILILDPLGLGVFAGLLWPLGIGVSSVINRHKSTPFLWLPLVVGMVVFLSIGSFITGVQSFEESLRILTPLLFPFAVLGPVYVLFRWLQQHPRPLGSSRKAWLLTAAIVLGIVQIPNAFHSATNKNSIETERIHAVVDAFANLPPEDRAARLLTDRPGLFLIAGKNNVYGLRGETDWDIHRVKYSNGEIRPERMIDYLRLRKIDLIHFAEVGQDKLIDSLTLAEAAPRLEPITGFSSPHRVFRVVWP
jgi:hypothetical protein